MSLVDDLSDTIVVRRSPDGDERPLLEARAMLAALVETPTNRRLSTNRTTTTNPDVNSVTLQSEPPTRFSPAQIHLTHKRIVGGRDVTISFSEQALADRSNLPNEGEEHDGAIEIAKRLVALLETPSSQEDDGFPVLADPILRTMLRIASNAGADAAELQSSAPMVVVESGLPYGLASCRCETLNGHSQPLLDHASLCRLTMLAKPVVTLSVTVKHMSSDLYVQVKAEPMQRRSLITSLPADPIAHVAAVRHLATLDLHPSRSRWT